jgi:hypothetical protein
MIARLRLFVPLVLMVSWPFVNFANFNAADVVNFSAILKYGLIFNAVMIVAALAAMAILRRQPAARVVNTLAVAAFVFFTFGAVNTLIHEGFGLGRFRYALALWGLIWIVVTGLAWHLTKARHATTILSLAAGAAILVPAFELAQHFAQRQEPGAPPAVTATAAGAATANVYFVVFDEYGRADQLLDAFGFDVAPFQDALRSQGFKIVARSHANLPMTHLSLTTTLAMDYAVPVGSGALDGFYGYKLRLRGYNEVVEHFRALGYRYVHAQPGRWEGSRCGGGEDLCIKGATPYAFNETEIALLRMTPLLPIAWKLFPNSLKYGRIQFPDVVARLKDFPASPYFLYAHLLQPHDLQFDADCSPYPNPRGVPLRDRTWGTLEEAGKAAYIATITCVNRQILKGVEAIIEADPGAIIVLQADHGFALGDSFTKPLEDWNETDFSRRFGVFNAMRLPPRCRSGLHETLSLVNTFRVVLACLEGRPPALLPDRSYVSKYNNPDIQPIREFP